MILRDRVPLRLPRLGLAMIGLLATSTLPAWSQKSTSETRTSGTGYSTISLVGNSSDVVATFGMAADPLPQDAAQLIAQYQRRKADAQRELEQRMSSARSELARQLKELQDRYTKDGKLDEAVAIRDRLRALEAGDTGSSAAMTGMLGGIITAIGPTQQSGNLTMFRDRVGQTLTLHIVGSTEGTVWGKDVYTDDSSLAAAAVHAGVLRPGEAGEVHVVILPGRTQYDGARQNGVESLPYDAWPGSYRFSAASKAGTGRPGASGMAKNFQPDALPDKAPHGRRVLENPGTLEELHDRVGQTFTCVVTGATDGPVWGGSDNVYTTDSSLATAAVHAGALRPGERGAITVTVLPDRGSYEGSTRNGVESQSWGAWHGSYRIGARDVQPHTDRPRESNSN